MSEVYALLTQEEIEERSVKFDVIVPLIEAMHEDMSALSARQHETLANAYKIRAINRLLSDAMEVLDREPSLRYLEIIDEEDEPRFSDVVLTLGQFKVALQAFKKRYYDGEYGWLADEDDEVDAADLDDADLEA